MLRPLLLLSALCLTACNPETPPPELPTIPFEQEGTLTFLRDSEALLTIAIEIADDDSTRTRGLMQRSGLPDRSGMLFIFDREQPQGFWMANTQISLDLLFANADSQIVSISKYTRPLSQASIPSTTPARFVVEVAAGFVDAQGIIESDRIRFRRTENP